MKADKATSFAPDPYAGLTLTLEDWAKREVPARRLLLGDLFSTTTRALLSADTGLGKTHLGFAVAFAIAAGEPFCHWRGHAEPARVLLVDGEMSVELLKERLADAERRLGVRPLELFVLSREDAEHMPPLDTAEGQDWLGGLIARLSGLDFLVLDNVMSLTVGDMADPVAWQPVAAWMRALTKRKTGALWVHHTGHDSSRAYGTKTREWQLDLVMVGERVEDPDADIAMRLTFPKARQRKPDTRADYEPVVLRLHDDAWQATADRGGGRKGKMPREGITALRTLREAIDEAGEPVPPIGAAPVSAKGVTISLWREYFNRRCPLDIEKGDDQKARDKATDARRKRFKRAREALQDAGHIECASDWVWLVQ